MIWQFLLCALGFVLLYYGAQWLVSGASSLAHSYNISPIIIGLTIVAFGTSAPELVVSLVAAIQGKNMMALGNVMGSNICNIGLVLGVSALFSPIRTQAEVMKKDIPIMLGVSLALGFMFMNNTLSRFEGGLLFSCLLFYLFYSYKRAQKEKVTRQDAPLPQAVSSAVSRKKMIFLIIAGIIAVVGGAELIVRSAEYIMRLFGVSEKFIGLTMVAFGTSLPELATSVIAAAKGQLDISLGNLIGSNLFNILAVLGLTALVSPIDLTENFLYSTLSIDFLIMLAFSCAPWLMARKDYTIGKVEGVVLLSGYVGYITFLVATS